MATIRFDDSLPAFLRVIISELGDPAPSEGLFIRDTAGRLAFFSRRDLSEDTLARVSQRLVQELGAYARPDRCIAGAGDFGVQSVLNGPTALPIAVAGRRIQIIDRRLLGVDWLAPPAPAAPGPPRFVFASLKGGVGRSTALAIAAAHCAARGRRILAIDLDMEAPGLGAMLLDDATRPPFGTLDALAESVLAPLDDEFYADLLGAAALAKHRGRIDVIPAFGSKSLQNPADVLAKIARAYGESLKGPSDQSTLTFADRVRSLVDHYSQLKLYDAIFVDARAGLHETSASPIMGLGAEVFLFALDEPQTFQAYSPLLTHLSRFLPDSSEPEWLDRLTVVQAKALGAPEDRIGFGERWAALLQRTGLIRHKVESEEVLLPAEPLRDVPWDEEALDEIIVDEKHSLEMPVPILDDSRFRTFDPLSHLELLEDVAYRPAFAAFLDRVDEGFIAGEVSS
ncbi:MAG TPA: hypothetical protein VGK52_09995 [Polyangia bacterium]|jgi:hypothetical protein